MKAEHPWEQSVVIALRDSQWLLRPTHVSPMYPDSYLALDGNAEAKLGDAIFLNDERLFIFEVKATKDQISDEWTRRDSKGELNPKNAYKILRNHLLKKGVRGQFVDVSLRGHFFCYWSEQELGGTVLGSLTMEPYLAAISCRELAKVESTKQVASDLKEEYLLGVPLSRPGDHPTDFTRLDTVSALHLTSNFAQHIRRKQRDEYEWLNLGLDINEFKDYVKFLCGNGDELARVVVMSARGTFFKYAESLSQLNSVFDPNSEFAMQRAFQAESSVVSAKRADWGRVDDPKMTR